jgi:hypothetical protein
MSNVLTFLSNLKLTLSQWLLLCLSTAVGLLVVALDLKGTQLHKAQVNLLQAQFGNAMSLQDAKVDAARIAFEAAVNDYEGHRND